jgi:hypothetical protein
MTTPSKHKLVFDVMRDEFFSPRFDDINTEVLADINGCHYYRTHTPKETIDRCNQLFTEKVDLALPDMRSEFIDVVLDAYNGKTISKDEMEYIITEVSKDETFNT